jgi:ribosomal protein S3
MGQKINPTIFRLGINKTWKTEFFEKKNHELPLYTFKDLEIKEYLERVLDTYGIILHDYKQHYNDSTLNLYISYFVTSDFVLEKKSANEKIILKNSVGERKFVKRFDTSNQAFSWLSILTDKKPSSILYSSRPYQIKYCLNLHSQNQLFQHLSLTYQRELLSIPDSSSSNIKFEGVFTEIFKVLNLFLGNQLNIISHFRCLNKNTHFFKSIQKKTFVSLQRFINTSFLKDGIELLFHVVYNKNSAHLLAKFIAVQLKKIKRHKFFLSFLKKTLTILLDSNLSKVKGIKLIVKGRLNGVPRARHKIIIIGDVSIQSISAKLDYSQITAHNSNGSYGIKVWVVEK